MQRTAKAEPISASAATPPRLVMNRQTWRQVSLLHWPVAVDEVQSSLPAGLIADTYEGRSYVSLVPFEMADVRTPPLPAMGRLSNFPELNVRVYVHDLEGHRGVWFLGLWCPSAPFVSITRALGFPYHFASARMQRANTPSDAVEYEFSGGRARTAESRANRLCFRARVLGGEKLDASHGLEAWLTARWNTFTVRAGALWRYQVHHEPWQLWEAKLQNWDSNVHEIFGLASPDDEPLVHRAAAVHTRVSMPVLCRR